MVLRRGLRQRLAEPPPPRVGRGAPALYLLQHVRAKGISAYLANVGTLEHAQQIAGHALPERAKRCGPTTDTSIFDEIEHIVIRHVTPRPRDHRGRGALAIRGFFVRRSLLVPVAGTLHADPRWAGPLDTYAGVLDDVRQPVLH